MTLADYAEPVQLRPRLEAPGAPGVLPWCEQEHIAREPASQLLECAGIPAVCLHNREGLAALNAPIRIHSGRWRLRK